MREKVSRRLGTMDPSDFCLANHLNVDFSLCLRFCVSCKKAMCEACHGAHKETCEQKHESEQPNGEKTNPISSPSGRSSTDAPPSAWLKTDVPPDERRKTSMPPRKKMKTDGEKETKDAIEKPIRDITDYSQNSYFSKCHFHAANEEYFCISHCIIVCQQCLEESHGTCTVKLVIDTCKDLNYKSVGEYRKWLNKLRVDCIKVKSALSKNVVGLDGQKQSALKELENEYLKITDRLESEMLEAKTEIIEKHDNHSGELCTNICHINAIVTELETALNDTKLLEGRYLDICLFQKFQKILFGHIGLPSELQSLFSSLRKVKINFKGNRRFQPMSNTSKLGTICVTTTKCHTDPIPNLNFPFELPKSYAHFGSERRKQHKIFSKVGEVNVQQKAIKAKPTINQTLLTADRLQQPIAYMKEETTQMNTASPQSNYSLNQIAKFSHTDAQNCSKKHRMGTSSSLSRIVCHEPDTAETPAISESNMLMEGSKHEKCLGINLRSTISEVNAVDFSRKMNTNASNIKCSKLKIQLDQTGLNDAVSSTQMDYSANQAEGGHIRTASQLSFLGEVDTHESIHTSGFTGLKGTNLGHQDTSSQSLYVRLAKIPSSVKDVSTSQTGRWNESVPNCSARAVAKTDTYLTKSLEIISTNSDGSSITNQNSQPTETQMPPYINAYMTMQKNGLFSYSQDQSSSFIRMEFQNMSASKCSDYSIRVEDDADDPNITGLSVTSDGRIILVDLANNKVKLLSHDKQKMLVLNVHEWIRSITVYKDTTAVVTGEFKLFFIHISCSGLRKTKSMETTFNPYGIQTCDKNLLVTCYGPRAVKLITMEGEVVWSISEDQEGRPLFSALDYITCFQDGNHRRIVVTDWNEDTLTVLDGDSGEVINVREVQGKCPCGTASDKRGNVYVCYENTCEVVVWNKYMTNSRTLVSTKGKPRALEFDGSSNQLIIAPLYSDVIEIFQLK